jgi:hypothetical protein
VFYAARSQRKVAAVIFGCTFPATEDRASAERSQGGKKSKEVVVTCHRVVAGERPKALHGLPPDDVVFYSPTVAESD